MLVLVRATSPCAVVPSLIQPAEFRTNKPSDIISTLISIYDSQELFVKELQILLAQRLLAVKGGNFDKEVSRFADGWAVHVTNDAVLQRRNIEILKIRFGEAALQVCEVMLKDMTDSKRTDQHIQSQHSVRDLERISPGMN